MHTNHESLHYVKPCPRPLTPPQGRWLLCLEECNLTLWYVPALKNLVVDACSLLTSSQLMDIANAARTRPFVVPSVENWASPKREVEFLLVLEDTFSHDEVWPQRYDHLYVSLRSGRSVGEDPHADDDSDPAPRCDNEPADRLEELEHFPTDEVPEDLDKPALRLNDAANELPHQSAEPDDVPETNTDRPL